jgi:hypothetical protein
MFVRGPDFEERFNRRFSPDNRQAVDEIAGPGNANRARLREIPRLLTCVIAAKWIVLTAHGKDKLVTNNLGYAPFINPKFGHKGLAIPLNQKTVLVIIPSMEDRAILHGINNKWIPNIEYANLPPGNHQGLNRALAHTALRFVFGPDPQTIQKYFLGVPQAPLAPEPSQLGFPNELLMPSFEFTWHRLVAAIRHLPLDNDGWDFPLN